MRMTPERQLAYEVDLTGKLRSSGYRIYERRNSGNSTDSLGGKHRAVAQRRPIHLKGRLPGNVRWAQKEAWKSAKVALQGFSRTVII